MTNARIIVEIPNEMVGKTFSFKDNDVFKYKTPDTTIPDGYKYVSVYVHGDGYIDNGVGDDLVQNYTNFSGIMESIVCGGDGSSIGAPYHAWRGEDFEMTKPKFSNDLDKIQEGNYNYLFKTDGKWYCKTKFKAEYSDWKPISKEKPFNDKVMNDIKDIIHDIKLKLASLEEKMNYLR
jgi:hypothetical protein